jgi:MYXO-CTERM domain-containing protein
VRVDGQSGCEASRRVARPFAAYGRRAAAGVLLLHSVVAAADYSVPANAVISLKGGTLDLGCTDLIVAGTLQLGSGQVVNARNVTLQAGGVLDGGSGTLQLGGDWSNSGSFLPGTGTVRFFDLCAIASATISGSSTFANARFVTSTGKNYVFAVGSTQTITGLLEITGTASHPIQFRNSVPGQVAFINLAAAGAQQIVHVGVTDVWATGQFLAPGQHNEGGGGNAKRWFGSPTPPPGEAIPVPALSDLTQGVLAALLALAAAFGLRRRTSLPVVGRIARGLRAERTRS